MICLVNLVAIYVFLSYTNSIIIRKNSIILKYSQNTVIYIDNKNKKNIGVDAPPNHPAAMRIICCSKKKVEINSSGPTPTACDRRRHSSSFISSVYMIVCTIMIYKNYLNRDNAKLLIKEKKKILVNRPILKKKVKTELIFVPKKLVVL